MYGDLSMLSRLRVLAPDCAGRSLWMSFGSLGPAPSFNARSEICRADLCSLRLRKLATDLRPLRQIRFALGDYSE